MKLPGIGYQIDTYQSLPNEIVITILKQALISEKKIPLFALRKLYPVQ